MLEDIGIRENHAMKFVHLLLLKNQDDATLLQTSMNIYSNIAMISRAYVFDAYPKTSASNIIRCFVNKNWLYANLC